MKDASAIVGRVIGLYRPFWRPLAILVLLGMLLKTGDLLVPFFAGKVIDAMAINQPCEAVQAMIGIAFVFWVCHGNLLPYLIGRAELCWLQYAAPRHLALHVLGHILHQPDPAPTKDTALQQAVIERGEVVLMHFMTSLCKVALPLSLPGVAILGLLLWWYPLIGLIALVGGLFDVVATVYVNRVLRPLYTRLQSLDYDRQRTHTIIFRHLLRLVAENDTARSIGDFDQRYTGFARFGISTGKRFLGFNLGRGLIINLTNLCTWLVGAWYVSSGVYSLGYFLASLSWSSYVLNMVGAGIELQKQWMETMPAIRAFFAEVDSHAPLPPIERIT